MAEVARVELRGDALMGVSPDIYPDFDDTNGGQVVCLGAVLQGQPDDLPQLAQVMQWRQVRAPAKSDWTQKAKPSLARMYCNDRMGCCVISGKAHKLGVWSANDGPAEKQCTDDEIVRTYNKWKVGPGDTGCYIDAVLSRWRDEGMPVAGQVNKIDGWIPVNLRSQGLAKATIHLFGGLTIGVNLPADWTNDSVWDVTNSRIVGGHDVEIVGYDERGLLVSSWGRIYVMTWAAYLSPKWVSEAYLAVGEDWYNSDKVTASGLNTEAIKQAMADIKAGREPADPTPPTPPTPPNPPNPPTPPEPGHSDYVYLSGYADSWLGEIPIELEGEVVHEHAHRRRQAKGRGRGQDSGWLKELIAIILQILELLRRRLEEGQASQGPPKSHSTGGAGGRVARPDRSGDAGAGDTGGGGGDDAPDSQAAGDTAKPDGGGGGGDGGDGGVVRPPHRRRGQPR